jgi:dTDP-4-dehydrorhamnose 3,5-epimerase
MKVTPTDLPEALLIEPLIFPDTRGHFFETWKESEYAKVGLSECFVQDNFSRSNKGTLRGLHFQEPKAQGKLITVLAGRVFDVVVDIRRGSPHFGQWVGVELNGATPRQVWVPPGFAHGFCVLSETADFFYKCTEFYSPETERSIRWDDPDLSIDWPIGNPNLSSKDAKAPTLAAAPLLPHLNISE